MAVELFMDSLLAGDKAGTNSLTHRRETEVRDAQNKTKYFRFWGQN
jgi:hypothetical protein